jgi:hypothetical protein
MTQSQEPNSSTHSQRNTKFTGQVVIVTGAAAGIASPPKMHK